MWQRIKPYIINDYFPLAPKGTAEICSRLANPDNNSITPIEWYEKQKAAGANIDIWFYENAAHGIFLGPIDRKILMYGGTFKRWGWTGASSSAADKLIADMDRFISSAD